jgi:hypothetical protein
MNVVMTGRLPSSFARERQVIDMEVVPKALDCAQPAAAF